MLSQKCALARCAVTKDLKSCAACNVVLYCCKDHQVEHFKEGGHKMVCPGRQRDQPLNFKQVMEKAQKFHSQSMFVAALPYYGAMLELTERTVGLFHFQVGNILDAMCTCYEKSGAIDKAVNLLQRVIIIKEVNNDESIEKSKEIFFTMGHLAELYMTLGHLELAKELLTKMEETARETFGDESFERGRALCSLAGCLERNGEIEEAERKLLLCCTFDGYLHPQDKSNLNASSIAFYNLGMLYFGQKKYAESQTKFEEAMKMKKEAGVGGDHIDMQDCVKMIDDCKAAE